MNILIQGNEQMIKLLNEWHQAMLQHQILKATTIKKEIDEKISAIGEDKKLLLYYSLLEFRYKVLQEGINISHDEFKKIEQFDRPFDDCLTYYYHLHKAMHNTILSNYMEAATHFEKAEDLLEYIPDELEKAEFYYRIASFYYQTYQPLVAIQQVTKSKEIFSKYKDYEINVALCNNAFGLCCIDLRQFEQAEVHLNAAIDILQKHNEDTLLLRVRHNIAWLYASQDLSNLAIRHISEVTRSNPNHFKALFVEAREYHKLGEYNRANELIDKGLGICDELKNKEFQHRFIILKELNSLASSLILEKVIVEGISYFEEERLWECVQEYTEILANSFYEEENHEKASKYFYISNKARKKYEEKGALV